MGQPDGEPPPLGRLAGSAPRFDDAQVLSFDYFVHGALFVVRLRQPDSEASREAAELAARHHAELRRPLLFALIIGTDCTMPAPEARRQLAEDQARLGSICTAFHTVVLGRELRQALVRSLVTGFSMLPGRPRPKLEGSIPELLDVVESEIGLDRDWLEAELISAHLIDEREAQWGRAGASLT